MNRLKRIIGIPLALAAVGCGAGGGGGSDTQDGGAGGPEADVGSATGASCVVTAGNLPISDAEATMPAIAYNGDRYAVAYVSLDVDAGDIRIAIVDRSGKKLSDQLVDGSPATSGSPSITVLSSGDFLVLWQDRAAAGATVRGRTVAKDGTPSGEPFDVATSGGSEARPVAVASSAAAAWIAWMDASDVFIGFANVGSAVGSKVSLGGQFPALAAADSGIGVAWTKGLGGAAMFARISAPGAAIAPVSLEGQGSNPSVAFEGKTFGVAWEDTRSGEEQIQFARVTADGTVVGELEVTTESGSANWPDLAFTGTHTAVVYYQFRDGPPSVYLSLVDADLQRAGQDLEVSSQGGARFPSVAWSGKELGVVWAEKGGPVKMARCACPTE